MLKSQWIPEVRVRCGLSISYLDFLACSASSYSPHAANQVPELPSIKEPNANESRPIAEIPAADPVVQRYSWFDRDHLKRTTRRHA